MTLQEIRASDKDVLTPAEIARVLHISPQLIRLLARNQPEQLQFPVCVVGTRTKIPRQAFLNWFDGIE